MHTERDPWYSRLTQAVLNTSGPMALVGLGLAAFLAWAMWGQMMIVQGKLDAIHNEMLAASARMKAFADTTQNWNEKREDLLEKQTRLLRQMCIQGADSAASRQACME